MVDILGCEKYIALNGVVMIGERAVKELDYPTACTNGRDEWYDPRFMEVLTDAQMRFVIIHENYHKMYRHLVTWVKLFELDAKLAGEACDYVINLMIVDDNRDGFATMPTGEYAGLIDERFREMSAAQVFNILRDEQEQEEKDKEGKGGEGKPGDGPPSGFDEHDWKGAQDLTEAEKHDLERDVDEAIRQGALTAGKLGSGGAIDVGELLKPQINWREALREFLSTTIVGNDYSSYRRPNRRYMNTGIYMPSGVSEAVGELILATDMSGSTAVGKVRPMFLSENQEICNTVQPTKVHVMYWDTKVAGHEVYKGEEVKDMTKNTKPCGGGGTQVGCVSERIKEENINAQAVVILTDGYLDNDWGTWTCPVLWCVVDNPKCQPPMGKVVHIDSSLI